VVKLFAKCPETGLLIETGVESDDDSLVIMAHSRVKVYCEKCGRHHVTRVKEMFCAAKSEDVVA